MNSPSDKALPAFLAANSVFSQLSFYKAAGTSNYLTFLNSINEIQVHVIMPDARDTEETDPSLVEPRDCRQLSHDNMSHHTKCQEGAREPTTLSADLERRCSGYPKHGPQARGAPDGH